MEIDMRADTRFTRAGVPGMWLCNGCGAAVIDRWIHIDWHDEVAGEDGSW